MNASVGAVTAPDIDIVELTIADVQKGLSESRFTTEDLVRLHLKRIETYEPFYNAFTFMNADAIAEAQEIDRKIGAGEPLGPLAGVPVVVKEAMDFAGLPSTAGWARLCSQAGGIDLIPERDAPVVARLRAAGAVILGKTNIPAFSHNGARANSSWDGPTFNAVDRSIAPGASSSGTAMAVSGSFAVVGLAEETGGSIQNPASAQSLVGVKPTFALVPNAGVAPLAGSTRDVVGPHARTVIDAALLLDVLAGYTPEDPKTVASIGKIPEGGYTSKLRKDALKGARLGLYGQGWRTSPLSEECASLYAKAVAELTALGATVVEDPFAGSGFASLAKQDVEFDDRGLDSIAYDLELFLRRLGPSAAANSLAALKALIPEDPFASDDLLGIHLKSMPRLKQSLDNPTAPPDLSEFLRLRLDYLKIFNAVMAQHRLDAVVFPQMSKALPGIFEKATYPATTVSEINITGLPGVTIPAGGRFSNGSPFSLIFVGPMWSETELLGLAFAYEQATQHRIVPKLVTTAYEPPKATV
jgi:Asp-tRNA(Asn)/Glu-tRNA(Gln) amidotransferase A subunit family amidase